MAYRLELSIGPYRLELSAGQSRSLRTGWTALQTAFSHSVPAGLLGGGRRRSRPTEGPPAC